MAHDERTRAILAELAQTHGGTRIYVPKKPPRPVEAMRAARDSGKTLKQIGDEFGVAPSTVCRRVRR